MSHDAGRNAYDDLVARRNNEIARAHGDMPRIRRIWEHYSCLEPTPADVESEPLRAGDVAGEWCRTPGVDRQRALLYLHGGGFCFGSTITHRRLYCELGRDAGCPVLAIDYRLAPENPFPAALHDAESAWTWLREQGYAANSIAVAGDSAGGGLALALVQQLQGDERDVPCALLLMSPWVDLSAEHIAGYAGSSRQGSSTEDLQSMAGAYAGDEDRRHPLVSPIGGRYDGAPPVLIQASTDELLMEDALAITRVLARDRVAVRLDLWRDQPHVWQAYWPLLDQARPAVRSAGNWLARQWR